MIATEKHQLMDEDAIAEPKPKVLKRVSTIFGLLVNPYLELHDFPTALVEPARMGTIEGPRGGGSWTEEMRMTG
jgi:hypothetical protein